MSMDPLSDYLETLKRSEAAKAALEVNAVSVVSSRAGRPVKLWIQEAVDEKTGLCKYCQKPVKKNTTKVKMVSRSTT